MKPATTAVASASGVLLLACSAVDCAIASVLLVADPPKTTVLVLIGVHLVVSFLSGLAVSRISPPFLRVSAFELAAFAGFVATFIPIFGALGVFAALLFGFTPPRRVGREPWLTFTLEKDFENRRPVRVTRRAVSAAEIGVALRQRSPETADLRFRSVLAIQKLPVKAGVPLLKLAQSDPVDEIRLYAFSRLEKMRDELEKQIKELTAALATAEKAEEPRLHLRLAESYWELGYRGLAEGAVLEHAMKSAHRHAAIACELLSEHSAAEFFLGRILVHLKEPERASIAFERAMTAGYPRIKVLPYLAECAFYLRDFATVRLHLGELDQSSSENLFFRSVMDFWRDGGAQRPVPPGSRRSLHAARKVPTPLPIEKTPAPEPKGELVFPTLVPRSSPPPSFLDEFPARRVIPPPLPVDPVLPSAKARPVPTTRHEPPRPSPSMRATPLTPSEPPRPSPSMRPPPLPATPLTPSEPPRLSPSARPQAPQTASQPPRATPLTRSSPPRPSSTRPLPPRPTPSTRPEAPRVMPSTRPSK